MITIFTPTYNRANLLERLYNSLLAQTDKDFEWLIVDDGSTDGTQDYVASICSQENPFEIIYVQQTNGGKHRAINRGVQLARGELFFIVDSDDYLLDDAVKKLSEWAKSLDRTKKWAGISGARGHSETEFIGRVYEKEPYIDAKNTERDKLGLTGDKAEAYFTQILRAYPFPEFEGENFITEEVVWNAIAKDGYYIRWFSQIIYICEYLGDGLTNSGNEKYRRNPQGVLYWAKQQLEIFKKSKIKKMKAVKRYIETTQGNKSIRQIAMDLGVSKSYCGMVALVAKLVKGVRKLGKG